MTDVVMETLLSRLARKLNLEEPEEELTALLEDELSDAEGELMLYLGVDLLDQGFWPKVVELAALFYRRDCVSHPDLKSRSYAEGQVSESETYLSDQDYQSAVQELFAGLSRYRRVTC